MIVTGLALGAVLGWVMQRGRFCVTGMIRDIFLNKTWRGFTALLIVIAVHAVGLAALTTAGVITPEYKQFAPLAVVLGGLLFGMGIVLAGGCAPSAALVEDLRAHARARLAGYKQPRSFDFVSALPQSDAGKILRADVRARYWAGRERSI